MMASGALAYENIRAAQRKEGSGPSENAYVGWEFGALFFFVFQTLFWGVFLGGKLKF